MSFATLMGIALALMLIASLMFIIVVIKREKRFFKDRANGKTFEYSQHVPFGEQKLFQTAVLLIGVALFTVCLAFLDKIRPEWLEWLMGWTW